MRQTTIKRAIELMKEGNTVYRLVNYFDVWGNKKDGYEVNNLCHENLFIVGDEFTEDEFIKILKKHDFLKKRYQFECEHWNLHEVFHKATGMPLFRLDEFVISEYSYYNQDDLANMIDCADIVYNAVK